MAGVSKVLVPKTQSMSCFGSPTVKVIVGNGESTPEQSFHIHASLLTSRSRFFAKALRHYTKSGEHNKDDEADKIKTESIVWQEGSEGIVRLPVDEPAVFANYAHLLYTGVLPIYDEPKKLEGLGELTAVEIEEKYPDYCTAISQAVEKENAMLGKLYVLCEKIQDRSAKQALLAAFVESILQERGNGSRCFPTDDMIHEIYDGTLESDPLREFLVDCYVYKGHSGWMSSKYDALPHEFLHDVLVGMFKGRAEPADSSKVEDAKFYQEKLQEVEDVDQKNEEKGEENEKKKEEQEEA